MEELNVCKIMDLPPHAISKELRSWIRKQDAVYRDQVLKEHLYGIDLEDDYIDDLPAKLLKEFNEVIRDNANRLDCAYFRIID